MLSPKKWFYIALAGIFAVGVWQVYQWVYQRGATHQLQMDTELIQNAERQRDTAIAAKDAYIAQYTDWVKETARNKAAYEAVAQADKARLQAQLDLARNSLTQKERDLNELQSKLDQNLAGVRMPVLVVRLWNQSLQGTATDPRELGTALAASPYGDDAAPTDVTLLELLQAGLRNNAQAVQRGMTLTRWQEYYARNEKAFAEHAARLNETSPKE